MLRQDPQNCGADSRSRQPPDPARCPGTCADKLGTEVNRRDLLGTEKQLKHRSDMLRLVAHGEIGGDVEILNAPGGRDVIAITVAPDTSTNSTSKLGSDLTPIAVAPS